jgi:guanylate kinase
MNLTPDSILPSLTEHREGLLFVVSGPSGAGKGTIVQQLLSRLDQVTLSISMTTRSPRPGEQHGVHYFFVTRDQFEQAIAQGQMLEYARYNQQYYGTPRAFVAEQTVAGQDVILEIEVQGALQIRQNTQGRSVHIFVTPPSWGELEARLRQRSTESEEAIQARLQRATEEMGYLPDYDYFVVNDQLESAVQTVAAIIQAERQRIQCVSRRTGSHVQ